MQRTSELDWTPMVPCSLANHELRFSLTSDSKDIYIWSESGTKNFPSNIIEYDRFGSAGGME